MAESPSVPPAVAAPTVGPPAASTAAASKGPFAVVLGIAQDGGYPQAGTKESAAWDDAAQRRLVASLGIVDPQSGRRWLVDCTPDFPQQLQRLDRIAPTTGVPGLGGILLTHAHVGHYAGLIHLGREAMGAHEVPVYAMPRMAAFLRGNGPWELLLRLGNVIVEPLQAGVPVRLDERLTATPLLVPHRDEYSETVAFRIEGPTRKLLWLPDIDKWEKWDAQGTKLEAVLAGVDVAYLDGTFFADGEIPGRSMAEIPHPFVRETIARLAPLPVAARRKVRFVHLNRTNPLIRGDAAAGAEVAAAGMAVAKEGEQQPL
ncbi:MAG TPA: MBL fold metallo-hydrolase [Thermoanaerobaculia bacterium]|nr:MBL fold metallo-hydrolase [Thermoanaerobaculia bacterium]